MPVPGEKVENRRLSGIELRKIIENHVSKMLLMDGMLAGHAGYGRVGFEVVIKLHLDNICYPEHVIKVRSQKNTTGGPPIEYAPLSNPTDQSVVVGLKHTKKIDNPNKERIKNGLPIPIERVSKTTGHIEQAEIKYDPADVGLDKDPDDAVDEDVTKKVKSEWEL